MNENSFGELLIEVLRPTIAPHKVEGKCSLLYDLSFDHQGVITKGIDPDGKPIKGKGHGFEQDILVFDKVAGADTSIVPRIVAELKFGGVTTHDVIVYSEKADRIRRVYPYIRYGFVLGGLKHIPGRVLRLGQRFDFIATISAEINQSELDSFCNLMCEEAAASIALTELLFGVRKTSMIRKQLFVQH